MDAPLGLALSRLLPFLLQGTTELLVALLGRLLSETAASLQPLVTWSTTENTAANLCGAVATGREVGSSQRKPGIRHHPDVLHESKPCGKQAI